MLKSKCKTALFNERTKTTKKRNFDTAVLNACGTLLFEKPHQEMVRTEFLADQFQNLYNNSDSILLSSTRPTIQVDPILWLPMTCSERSRVLRWRLGWLPDGKPK
ncbi:hypothetical protein G6F56_002764 [Rhizopus delemar]|nr:hypothetical protein G6F56_002764 [Rhizopus delemar]